MGIETAIGIGVSLVSAGAGFLIPVSNQDSMEKPSLDDFSPTMASEGTVIPLVYGTRRIPGNLVWYGNLRTSPIEESSGGKGIGSASQTTGYKFYVDCWQTLCMGKIEILKKYVDDEETSLLVTDYVFNDGTSNIYPSFAPEYASPLKGVAWLALEQWYIGENKSSLPTIHYVVKRILPSTIPYANMSNGSNPAAIVYDMLTLAGTSITKINLDSFTTAASYYYNKGYGLNLIFESKTKLADAFDKIFGYVDGMLFIDGDGKYAMRAISKDDVYSIMVSEQEIKDFSISRSTWDEIPNEFTGSFIDEDNDFSERAVSSQNYAAMAISKIKNNEPISLDCFLDGMTASKRITEIMKRQSYPALDISFTGNLSLSTLLPGDIVRLSHVDYGIVSSDFRVNDIDVNIDGNEVKIDAVQMVETLYDDIFVESGDTEYSDPRQDLVPLQKMRVFELPYNDSYKFEQAFFVLAARENLSETSFLAMVSSTSDGDYTVWGEFITWSQHGILQQTYTSSTRRIDDEIGIVFTPYKIDPIFDTISRQNLFSIQRAAIIGDEIIRFQTVTPLDGGDYKLTGIVRGVLNTIPQTHNAGSQIYLTYWGKNILRNIKQEKFYVKIVPKFLSKILPVEDVTPIYVESTHKAMRPRNPGYISAVRSGGNVSVQIYPNTPGINGAGDLPESIVAQEKPFPFAGDFQIEYDTISEILTSDSFTISRVGEFTLTVKSRLNGFISSGLSVQIGSTDGYFTQSD